MSADMRDEVDAHSPGPLVPEVAVQSERPEVSLEFAAQEGRRLPAAGVARFLRAEEDEVAVWAGAGGEGRWEGEGRGWGRRGVVERCAVGGGVGDERGEEGGYVGWRHVVDVEEGRKEEHRRGTGWIVGCGSG